MNSTSYKIEKNHSINFKRGIVFDFKNPPKELLQLDELGMFQLHEIECYYQSLREEIERRFLRTKKWRAIGVQLSLSYDSDESILGKIFELQTHCLLIDLHEIIFKYNNNYLIVYNILKGILSDINLLENYQKWMKDPLNMVIECLRETSKEEELVMLNPIVNDISKLWK